MTSQYFVEKCREAMIALGGRIKDPQAILNHYNDSNRKPYLEAIHELIKLNEWVKDGKGFRMSDTQQTSPMRVIEKKIPEEKRREILASAKNEQLFGQSLLPNIKKLTKHVTKDDVVLVFESIINDYLIKKYGEEETRKMFNDILLKRKFKLR